MVVRKTTAAAAAGPRDPCGQATAHTYAEISNHNEARCTGRGQCGITGTERLGRR